MLLSKKYNDRKRIVMLKKILSCILITLTVLALFSGCADDGVPDGMYSATIEGEPYVFYVPEGWTDNRDSGISSAYYSLDIPVLASARYYTPIVPEGEYFSLEGYVGETIEAYSSQYATFALDMSGIVKTKLGTVDALKFEYTVDREQKKIDGSLATIKLLNIQYFAQYKNDVVVLSIYCNETVYDDYKTIFDAIVKNFAFRDKTAVKDGVVDGETPAGMKRVSFDGSEYRFYVPSAWKCNMSDKLTEAYYPEIGKPNVSVTSFAPDMPMTVDEYFAECSKTYSKEITGFDAKAVKVNPTKIDKRAEDDYLDAKQYTYSAIYSGTEYKIMQTIFVYNNMLYSITYTARADRFDAHLADVNKMLTTFKFR